jgi:hypothetical protein
MIESTGRSANPALELIREALNRPNGLTFQGARDLRTEIGHRISGSILPEAGTSMPALKRIYEAMTVDINNAALHGGGPAARRALGQADTVHRLISQRREALARIVGESGDAPAERVFGHLIGMAQAGGRADMRRLWQARRAMGDAAWDEVAAAAVRRFGQGTDGGFSPARFLREYDRLTPNGRHALFGSTGRGELRQALEDIATVSRRYQDTMNRYANPSGTGRALTTTLGIAGAVTAPWHTIAGIAAGYGLANVLSRPVTARAVARYLEAQAQRASRPGQATAVLAEQAERQLRAALQAEAIRTNADARGGADIAPWQTTVHREPRADLAGNQTYRSLVQRGVHPEDAERALRDPRLLIDMQRDPGRWREPGTPAERKVAAADRAPM